jgi:hypothetical protein
VVLLPPRLPLRLQAYSGAVRVSHPSPAPEIPIYGAVSPCPRTALRRRPRSHQILLKTLRRKARRSQQTLKRLPPFLPRIRTPPQVGLRARPFPRTRRQRRTLPLNQPWGRNLRQLPNPPLARKWSPILFRRPLRPSLLQKRLQPIPRQWKRPHQPLLHPLKRTRSRLPQKHLSPSPAILWRRAHRPRLQRKLSRLIIPPQRRPQMQALKRRRLPLPARRFLRAR